jgi:O-succinylbenzoic acid--CoA ligase
LVLETSGSAGQPKLVALSADAIRASAELSARRLGGTGHWLLALPADHMAGLNVICRALLAGTTLAAYPDGPFTADGFARAAAKLPPGPKYTSLVPTQLARLVAEPALAAQSLPLFDAVLVGGAPLAQSQRAAATAAGGRIVETYGCSETCGGCVYDGWPLDGIDVELGPDGCVELSGPTLALGYVGQGDGPFFTRRGRRWLRTRDLGRWAGQRQLEVIGRADNAISSGGLTIFPELVENALANAPAVAKSLVVGLPEPLWGQLITALVVPETGRQPSLAELRDNVKAQLPSAYAPRQLGLVETIPELSPGKPDRQAAYQLAAQLEASRALERLG